MRVTRAQRVEQSHQIRLHAIEAGVAGARGLACHPARVLTLLISDVPGDDPIDIACGPTVARRPVSTPWRPFAATASTWRRKSAPCWKAAAANRSSPARLARAATRLIATPQMALEAAARVAREAGVAPYILGDAIEGEARDVGKVLAGIALQVAERGQPVETWPKPVR